MRELALAVACCLTVGAAEAPAPQAGKKPPVEAILKVAAKAPPLPKPSGNVLRVADAAALRKAVASAKPGTTILLADGRYQVERLWIRTDRLTLRGESGNREKVILDGRGKFTRILVIEAAKDLLIADLTVANSGEYGIFFYGDSDVQRLKVRNVKFHNCWTRGLKGSDAARIHDSHTRRYPLDVIRKIRPAGGEVRYCLFVNDHVNPRRKPFGGDYIGGIDMMWAKDWVIADNVFVNIRGRHGGGRGAIFFWVNGENVVAERNLIFNCDRGICFGNPSGKAPHMTGGVVRNNFIVAGPSEAIEICKTRNTTVYSNTIFCARPTQRAVQFHHGNAGGRFVNNLVRGEVVLPKDVTAESNLTGKFDGWFVNPAVGDLHLTAKAVGAVGKGRPLKEVAGDFDGRKRKSRPDLGADEVKTDRGGARSRPSRPSPPGKAKPVTSTPARPRGANPDVAKVLKVAARAPPLPKPKDPIIRVKTADALYKAVRSCKPGTTILLADGVYDLYGPVVISTDRVSLRGASGDREKVILDRGGGRRRRDACVLVAGADDVLVADLTCRNSDGHGVQIAPHVGAQRTRIYNCKFHNLWTRGVKGSHPSFGRRRREEILRKRPKGGQIRYCLFLNDRRKTRNDPFRGDYVGGIDMMCLKDWVIADNVFIGIRGRNGGGRGAIFIWVQSEDVVVERNIIINCDRGICFGNPSGGRPHMTRGLARNNFIVGGAGKAIEMCRTVDTKVYHNTVVGRGARRTNDVHFFQGSKGGRFFNNIASGRVNLEAGVASGGNIIADCTGWFVNPAVGDLHLTGKAKAALGKARRLKDVAEDFDGQKRKAASDAGADQLAPPPAGR